MENKSYEELVELYEKNENLVYYTLKTFYPEFLFDEDVRQEGRIGLWKACGKWDESKGAFSTYAVVCIKRNFYGYFRNLMRKKNPKPETSLDDLYIGQTPSYKQSVYVGEKLKDVLTERQLKIFELYMKGMVSREIGEVLGVSHATVDTEKNKIKQLIIDNTIDI